MPPPALPQAVILMMSDRSHRMHHYLWHTVREGWLRFDGQTQQKIRQLGWAPPRPALKADRTPILDNSSGEDFFYMHTKMIAAVNAKLAQVQDPNYARVVGWPGVPAPGDTDWPVPPVYQIGNPGADSFIKAAKADSYFADPMQKLQAAYTDAAKLKKMSLGELGARIQFSIHNEMHMRWSAKPDAVRPDDDITAADAIDPKWDDPKYNWLGDTYSSHVNPIFWKLHGWVDDCIERWKAANGITGDVQWKGTWVGPMPMNPPAQTFFALMPKSATMGGPDHMDHMANMVSVAKILRGVGFACHFYDKINMPSPP